MKEQINEQWRWEFNRKIAEYVSNPSREQEATLGFLLSSYRIIHSRQNMADIKKQAV